MQVQSDEARLAWAAERQRASVTFMSPISRRCMQSGFAPGGRHAGIVVSSQRPIGDLLQRLIHLARALDGGALKNRLEYLSDW